MKNHLNKHNTNNNKFNKSKLALLIAAALTTGSQVYAAESDEESAEEETGVRTITVTARKTEESLQNVPVAITAIDGGDLEDMGVSVLTEIQQFSPNTTLQSSRGTNSTLTAFIRGVGQEDPLWGYEPGVGIYIDDVYVARPQGAVLDLLDVERIEVLRGPQGSLYGKNTIGGAIKFVTKRMSGETEFGVRATFGDYGRTDLKVNGQIPLIEDKLYFGFAAATLQRDGFGEFVTSDLDGQDRENYNKDVVAGRLTLEYSPTDELFFKLAYDKTEDESNSKGGYRLLPSLLTEAPVPDSVYDSYTSLPTWNKVETEGYSLTINYDINEHWSFKSVTAGRESYSPTNIDFDNTSLRIFDVPAFYDDEQFSQEFQLNYDTDDLTFVSGLYFFDGDSCGHFDAILEVLGQSIGFPGLTREVKGCSDSNSKAIYAQGSYDLTDRVSMTLGARYTQEEKEAYVFNGLVFDTIYPETGWVPGYVRDDATIDASIVEVLNDSEEWSRFTPRVGVEFQQTDDVMWFASYSQGFKSGLFNPRATFAEEAADPEKVDSYEVGVRSDFGRDLRVNATLFVLDHTDRQFVSVLPGENPGDLEQRLGNIGESEATGAEIDINWAVTNSLDINLSLGLIDSKFSNAVTNDVNDGEIDISDRFSIINTPETTANLSFNYNFSNTLGDFNFSGNYYYRSEYELSVLDNLLTQDGYGLANLSLNWYSDDGNWQAGLHAKNITDEEYLVGNYTFVTPDGTGGYIPGLGGDNTLIGYYGDPRTIALTVGYQF
ncbi:MAG: TonB-dependent receptor [Kangiellaceae bacterium]|jgi:iron complex outermembrane recepter protein